MAVQSRNSELVSLLSPDFIRKNDGAYLLGLLNGTLLSMPGLVALWPMGVSLNDDTEIIMQSFEARYAASPRYAVGLQPLSALAALYAYDHIGAAYIPMVVDGSTVSLRPGADGNKALSVDAAGTVTARGTTQVLTTTEQWTTDLWSKSLELGSETVIQWLKAGGSISRGIGFSADGNLYFIRSAADDTSAAPTYDMTLGDGGELQPAIAGEDWLGMNFGSGWGNYGGTYVEGEYKKFGDLVFLRGLVARTSGVGTVIANLPVGYRPLNANSSVLLEVITDTGQGRVDIDSSGNITQVSGGTTWVSFNAKNFSVL